ncbi:MAG: SUMF1/EgtB/PvdO family nonheme iron enzyme [Phycisphaerae bacterium]|nr:SUMF1/EgtB/PvdO family nonheme iron enzyme [Phycisphaerae bacterium]
MSRVESADTGKTTSAERTTASTKATDGGAAAVRNLESDDDDATWNPEVGDPPEVLECFGDESREKTKAPGSQTTCNVATDPDATYVPGRTRDIEAVWGDALHECTPENTLRNPDEPRLALRDRTSESGATPAPNLSEKGYDVIKVLGEGGVGIVYQVVQKSIGREIAVKMMKPCSGRDAGQTEKFVAEALVTGKLDHPNILPIHDLDRTADGQPFYTMKMVRGTPWSEVIRDKSLTENLTILADVCDAISFAHAEDVVHRDLKPENVMLGEFGEVQLLDWGMGAWVSGDGRLVDSSVTHAAGGTPAYMAPEMVTGEDGPVGIHSDAYLLGAILFEIVTGKPPHPGRRVLDSLENARRNVIRPPDSGGVLVDIALTAMQTRPSDRYSSVGDFRQALLDYQRHAQSITLCERSADDLRRAGESEDYELFAQARFGFRQALAFWDENAEARVGIMATQLEYARCAFKKGDYDLARSMLDENDAEHRTLAAEVESARCRRDAAKRRLKMMRVAAVSLIAAVIVILTVASIWINRAKRQAVVAKEDAIAAKEAAVSSGEAEARQRRLAESATARAKDEEARAIQALSDLEKAYADLVEAQKQEKRARAEAKASEQIATETRDELAKTGMLLDNSWWVFDAETARRMQEDAASAIAMPVELTIPLAGDTELVMMLVPSAVFVMGSPPTEKNRAADEHLHRVHLRSAFYMSKFELTEGQWLAATGDTHPGSADREPDATLPVSGLSFKRIVSRLLPALQTHAPKDWEFSLPSEAEWEFACRAGTGTAFYLGDSREQLDSAGWFLSNSERRLQPVGRKTPNAFGLHDMHGNVGEVCSDQYSYGFYLESPTEEPFCRLEGETPVVRGGSVLNTPEQCRSAYRSYVYSKNEYPFIGLRLVMARIRDGSSRVRQAPAGEPGSAP